MEQYLTVVFSPDKANRQAPTQFTAGGFVANTAIKTNP
jgi:hypothetical protein